MAKSLFPQFITTLLTFLLLFPTIIPTAAASPLPARAVGRNTAFVGIYICTGANWTGTCDWHVIEPNDREGDGLCLHINHPGGMASFGPDCGIEVDIFLTPDCTKEHQATGNMVYPGFSGMTFWGPGKKQEDVWVKVRNVGDRGKAFNDNAGCPR